MATIFDVTKDVADGLDLAKTHNKKKQVGRLPTVLTNCSASDITTAQLGKIPKRFVLTSKIKTSRSTIGMFQYMSLDDGRHLVSLFIGSVTTFEDYHTMTLTWENIYFQTTFGSTGLVYLEVPPIDLLNDLPQITRDTQLFIKFSFSYNGGQNFCDERLINSLKTRGVRVVDGAACVIL